MHQNTLRGPWAAKKGTRSPGGLTGKPGKSPCVRGMSVETSSSTVCSVQLQGLGMGIPHTSLLSTAARARRQELGHLTCSSIHMFLNSAM